ncbi:DNA-binding protein [Idiomarina tyrosinivorans]|uniref:Heat shock protein HspQ n=1 Tax=Idiomarina tyrosinivorans TaxID=1445662 RepID=A0A432ZUF6_9GAMM|nr:DNA-binding protein [Idiomarina tyrosinivorans]
MVYAKHAIGEVVRHSLYGYRGVIIDVDAEFSLSDNWYDKMATTRPDKSQPWYQVLVNNSSIQTYVSEELLEHDGSQADIQHPLIDVIFAGRQADTYQLLEKVN